MLRVPMFLYLGLRHFTKGGYERAARSFPPSKTDSPDALVGRTVLVTGASLGGIGYQIALDVARRGATVHMVMRDQARGQAAVDKVRQESENQNIELKLCDLGSLESIKALASEYVASKQDVHVLVCNAGLMVHGGERSVDGFEMNFAVNTLGTFALIKALEPALARCAPSRIIVVSSGGSLTEHLEVDDLEMLNDNKSGIVDGTIQYARDKRRQLAIVEQLVQQYKSTNTDIGVYAMHPGWTETEGVKKSMPGFYESMKHRLRTLQQGADTVVYLACEDKNNLENGAFYLDRKPQAKHLPLAGTKYSQATAEKLMQRLSEMLQSKGFVN